MSETWKYIPAHIAEGAAEVRHTDGWIICTLPSDELARFVSATPDLESVAQKALILTNQIIGAAVEEETSTHIAVSFEENDAVRILRIAEVLREYARAALSKAGKD